MDSSLCEPAPRSLKSLVCDVKYPDGNYLIHQFVVKNSERRKACISESYIRAVLRSFPVARVNSKNYYGFTALHLAVIKRNSFVVKMLLSCLPIIDVNAKCEEMELQGNGGTALHLAAAGNDLGRAYLNLKNIILDKAVKEDCLEIIKILIEYGAFTNIKNTQGETPLHVAARRNQIDLIKVLISHGAELNIKDKFGITPLHRAVYRSELETVKLLVENGADINAKCESGRTPLHVSADCADNRDIMKYLISKSADLNAADKYGATPLHEAVYFSENKTIDLVKNGAHLNAEDERGQTPLHIAARSNNVDIVKFLIGSGADVNTLDRFGDTPLLIVFSKESNFLHRDRCLQTVKALVEGGADVNAKNQKGETALTIVEKKNFIDIVEFLKDRIAANAVDSGDETSLPEAASSTVSGQPPFKRRRTSET